MDAERRVRLARILGIAFCAAGFIAIGLGWNGAASKGCIDCQIPYLISGAATGIGLIVFGIGLILMAQIREAADRIAGRLERSARPAEAVPETAATPSAASRADARFVAGGATYHRADCRLVKERPNLPHLSEEAARSQGLTPCRVCRPEESVPDAARRGAADPIRAR
ncbi:MAG: hypothetical protein HY775_06905 [Acidobacteria bacterium]|nr:hypothetical protein [Acidobacteriota bacterium]